MSDQAFESFVRWESSTRDTIDLKKIYVDMAGDLIAGVMLSQIVYWHLPSLEDGRTRLRVERDGHMWVAKTRDEWWDECRVKPRQADRALKILEDAGLIQCEIYQFRSSPTKHVRILKTGFMRAFQAALRSNLKPEVRSNGSVNSISRNGENDLTDSGKPYTETTAEITPENTVVEKEAPIDDVTARCLLLLNRTRGFPRGNAENAIKLAEYREDFPLADPEEVCKDLKAWASENPGKRIDRLRLRNFFKSADGRAREASTKRTGATRGHDQVPISGEDGRERRQKDYSWLFEDSKPAPNRSPGLLALVPDDQRDGPVAPEVRKILLRRLDELADQGYEAFARGVGEIVDSPWVDYDTRMMILERKREMAPEAAGDARSA